MRCACSVNGEQVIPHLPPVTGGAVVNDRAQSSATPSNRGDSYRIPVANNTDSRLAGRAAGRDAEPGGCEAGLVDGGQNG